MSTINKQYPYTNNINEVIYNLDTKVWGIDTLINFKYEGVYHVVKCGIIKILEITGILIDYELNKKGISKLITEINKRYPSQQAEHIIYTLNDMFFSVATASAISISMSDLKKTDTQNNIMKKAIIDANNAEDATQRVKIWDTSINTATQDWINTVDKNNPLYLMMKSGARVSDTQIRQMVIAKGLLINMDGSLSENAVPRSLTEGLTAHDYFRTCGPARKGLAGNHFIVPVSGYLERQLVNGGRDLKIVCEDCKSDVFSILTDHKKAKGRYIFVNNKVVLYDELKHAHLKILNVRSPLYCEAEGGLCQICCGINPNNEYENNHYRFGVNMGIKAAQFLSEPTLQLGLNGKHCFTGDEKVIDVNGNSFTFKQLYNLVNKDKKSIYVHSCSKKGVISVSKILKVWKNHRDNQYLEVTLDDDTIIKCTIDHPFLLRNGEYKQACDLKPLDSLMPYYTRVRNERIQIKNNLTGTYVLGYVISAEHDDCKYNYSGVGGKQIHHIDLTKTNDYPNNLTILSCSDHMKIHGKIKSNRLDGNNTFVDAMTNKINSSLKYYIDNGIYDISQVFTGEKSSRLLSLKSIYKLKPEVFTDDYPWYYIKGGIGDFTKSERRLLLYFNTITNMIIRDGKTVNKENYNKYKKQNYKIGYSTKYETGIRLTKLLSEGRKVFLFNNNHKVKSIKLIKTKNKQPFFDLEVDSPNHNYPVGGVFVHNSSGSVTLDSYNKRVENSLSLIIKAIGSVFSLYVKNDSKDAPSYNTIDGETFFEKSDNLTDYLMGVFSNAGIRINRVWFEIVIRAMSDIQFNKSTGKYFIRSHDGNLTNYVDYKIYSIMECIHNNPSLLKRMIFDNTKNQILKEVNNPQGSKGLPCERLIRGDTF